MGFKGKTELDPGFIFAPFPLVEPVVYVKTYWDDKEEHKNEAPDRIHRKSSP
jgi:hypothetical protein